MTHKVQVEYGNVGVDFKYVPREGFGWMNASFQIGLSIISTKMRRALGTCTHPDLFFEKTLKQSENININPEEVSRRLRRRKSSEIAARNITRNGKITAAITRIGPNELVVPVKPVSFLELTEK
jgi:alpha,alpha-trehalase